MKWKFWLVLIETNEINRVNYRIIAKHYYNKFTRRIRIKTDIVKS